MPVPSAVTAKREREEADLRSRGINPASGAPIEVQTGDQPAAPTLVSSSPAAQAPAAPTDELTQLREQNAKLDAELKTQNGRASALAKEVADLNGRFDAVNSNRLFLETTVAEQAEKLATQSAAPAAPAQPSPDMAAIAASLSDEGPTDDQKKEFGDSLDFVMRVVRKELATVVKPLLSRLSTLENAATRVQAIEAKLPRFEKTAEVTDMNAARQKEVDFIRAEIVPHFPDFETFRNTPEWRAYLHTNTSRGYTIGELLGTYRVTGNAVGIRSLIGAYLEQQKLKPSLETLAVPAKTAADALPAPTAAKMKSSEYKANLRLFTSKRMAKAEWEAYRARWDEAIQTGNVEMDVEVQ